MNKKASKDKWLQIFQKTKDRSKFKSLKAYTSSFYAYGITQSKRWNKSSGDWKKISASKYYKRRIKSQRISKFFL